MPGPWVCHCAYYTSKPDRPVNDVPLDGCPLTAHCPAQYVRGTLRRGQPRSSVSKTFTHRLHKSELSASCHISRNSLFGLSNIQAFIYFQTHRGEKITFLKLVVRPSGLIVSCIPDITSGHLPLVCPLDSSDREHRDFIVPRTSRAIDGLHLALIIHSVYHYLVIDQAIITPVTKIVWSFKVSPYLAQLLLSLTSSCSFKYWST